MDLANGRGSGRMFFVKMYGIALSGHANAIAGERLTQTNFLSAHGLQKVRSVIRKRSEAVDCPKLSGFGPGGFHRIFLIPLTIRNERSAFGRIFFKTAVRPMYYPFR